MKNSFKELTGKTEAALQADLQTGRRELGDMRMKLRTGQTKNQKAAQPLRRNVARILTALRAKQ